MGTTGSTDPLLMKRMIHTTIKGQNVNHEFLVTAKVIMEQYYMDHYLDSDRSVD